MKVRARADGRTDVVGLLDIGTAKTVCLLALREPGQHARLVGGGAVATRGLKAGVVVEMDGVEQAVRAAVHAAESAAGLTMTELVVAVACGRLRAQTFAAEVAVARAGSVSRQDSDKLLVAGRAYGERDGRIVLDVRPLFFRLDGMACDSPYGLPGRVLGADLVAVTADEMPIRNLMHAVDRAGFATTTLVPAPLAAGTAVTTEEERQLGVLCLDLGAGTTQLSLFAEGQVLACDVIPVGGNHITFDLARGLSTSLLEAERIKREYGTLQQGDTGDSGGVPYAATGAENTRARHSQAPHGAVRQIIEARVGSLLVHILERIERTGLPDYVHRSVVVCGGASQLPGFATLAERVLRRPVRLAGPLHVPGLAPEFQGPAFATVVGMGLLPADVGLAVAPAPAETEPQEGYLRRMGQWLRNSF